MYYSNHKSEHLFNRVSIWQPKLVPISADKTNSDCLIKPLNSPFNIPLSNTSNVENVPPIVAATAHILIELATSNIVFKGGWLLIIAPSPAHKPAPIIIPNEIRKLYKRLPNNEFNDNLP